MSGTSNDNEWQRVRKIDNEWQKMMFIFTFNFFCYFVVSVTINTLQLSSGGFYYTLMELITKKITSFSTNPFISGQFSKATAFMVTPKMMINALTFCF